MKTESPGIFPGASLASCRYGYRGRDCRANIYLLPTGEIVYFIASVVVLFNYEERTQRHYLGHTDCVKWWENTHMQIIFCSASCWSVLKSMRQHLFMCLFSLAIHPDKIRIATGQIAGVDKDGRVGTKTGYICNLIFLTELNVMLNYEAEAFI